MGSTKKLLALSMAIASVSAACGGGDSSSSRQRNSAIAEVATCVTAQKSTSDAVLVDLNVCADAVRYSVSLNDTAENEQKDVPADRKLQVTTFGIDPTAVYKIRSFAADGTLIATDVLTFTYGTVGGEGKSCADGGACVPGDGGPSGGTVFYAADSSQQWGQYLAALPMIDNKVVFGCNNVVIEGTTDGIGDGAANTSIIEKACADDPSPAVTLVRSALPQAYLPTRLEMFEMAKVLGGRDGFIFDLNAVSPPNRPIVSYMPMVGVEGTSDTEVHRRNNVVDFMLYPTGWSHMQTFRTTEYNVWPVYAFSRNDERPVATVTVTPEIPTAEPTGNGEPTGGADDSGASTTEFPPTNVTAQRVDDKTVTVRWTNPSWADFASSRVEFRYTNMEVNEDGSWSSYVYVDLGTASTWTGAAGVLPNLADLEFRVVAFNADKSVSYRSATVLLKDSTETSTNEADEVQTVVDACAAVEQFDDFVTLVGAPFTTDQPVVVETSAGCDIPEKFSDRVRVEYSFTLVGDKHFTDWNANGIQYPQSLGSYTQLLPADNYTLNVTRHVTVDGLMVNSEVTGPVITKTFEVTQGDSNPKVECADSDMKMAATAFEFPCQFVDNLLLSTVKRTGEPLENGYFSGSRVVDLKKLGSGWHRVEVSTTGALLRQMWRLYVCHTDCGPVNPPSGYSVSKSGDVITIALPPCDVPEGMRLDAGLIAPLRRLSSGVLRRPRFDYGLAMKLGRQKSFDNLANEIIVLGRSESITISNSTDIAGVEFTETAVCMTAGNVTETAILGSSTAGSSSPSETTQPPKVDSTGVVQPLTVDVATVIASPVKIADNVTRVDITLTDSSDDSSALSMSLDGTTWVPVPRGQPVSLNRSDLASLQVRSVNSKGEMRQVVQTVVSNASGESSSNVSGTVSDGSDSPSSSKLWIVVVILVLLILVAVLMRGRRSKAND